MEKFELKIRFAGICGHYSEQVTGVPHRVVMPDTSGVHFGVVTWEDGGTPVTYCLLPHRVLIANDSGPLPVPVLVSNGQLLVPARLRVVNAIDRGMDYRSSYDLVPRIGDYVQDFTYSREVVLLGRAAAYFDFLGGVVEAHTDATGRVTVTVTIETDGPPTLGVTPFSVDGRWTETQFPIKSAKLFIANSDMDSSNEDKPFDFLLHYLAAEDGLPAVMLKPTPGLGKSPSQTDADMAAALSGLGKCIGKKGLWSGGDARKAWDSPDSPDRPPAVMNASCSDIRYP